MRRNGDKGVRKREIDEMKMQVCAFVISFRGNSHGKINSNVKRDKPQQQIPAEKKERLCDDHHDSTTKDSALIIQVMPQMCVFAPCCALFAKRA